MAFQRAAIEFLKPSYTSGMKVNVIRKLWPLQE